MESTLSVYSKTAIMNRPKHRFAELYEINGMENITVSEPAPSSSLYPFLFSLVVAGCIAWVNVGLFGLPH